MSRFKCIFVSIILSFCTLGEAGPSPIPYQLIQNHPPIYIDPRSEKIGHTWYQGTVWDQPVIEKFYAELSKKNEFFVVFDLGAQTGCFSLLAKFFPNSQWYAFEPIYEAVEALNANLSLNQISNVSVYQAAASNTPGWAQLKMPNKNAWGLSTLGNNVLRFSPVLMRTVQCIDLDSFITTNQIEKVDFMKLDTEGWEYYILQGATKLIQRDHPVLLMEYNETNMKQCNVNKNDLHELLQSMGYTWELIGNDDILCLPNS